MSEIERLFVETVAEHGMLDKGDCVVVALSGGPDSVCLLCLMHTMKDFYGVQLYAAHVNHCLRDDADEDQVYVERLCERLSIPIFVRKADVASIARKQRQSVETAARDVRYEFFRQCSSELKCAKIATAHNKNDQAETVIMRLLRGNGISAIPYKRDNIIRPLLNVSRKLICDYSMRFNPRHDYTNSEPVCTRNIIRLEILPSLLKLNPSAVDCIAEVAAVQSRDEDYLKGVADSLLKENLHNEGMDIAFLKQQHQAVVTRIFKGWLELLGLPVTGINIYGLYALLDKKTSKTFEIPPFVAIVEYGRLLIIKKQVQEDYREDFFYHLPENGSISIGNYRFETTSVWGQRGKYAVNLDKSKLELPLLVRSRREGDIIYPVGIDGSKSVKKLLIDNKIPNRLRATIPLLVSGEQLVWVVGLSCDRRFMAEPGQSDILRVEVTVYEKQLVEP